MPEVYIYVLGANANPNAISCCKVPYNIDSQEIFFGPCKKKLRQDFYNKYLLNKKQTKPDEPIYMIGVNASYWDRQANKQVRKIIWAGKIKKLMTFEHAYYTLRKSPRYNKMINQCQRLSPLHVKPVKKGQGYSLRSKLHEEGNNWITDLVNERRNNIIQNRSKKFRLIGRDLIALNRAPFQRDCCMLLDNIFFAEKRGIEFDKVSLCILKGAQPGKSGIDEFAIFGRKKNGSADGLTGSYLKIEGQLATDMIDWVVKKADVYKKIT